MSFQQSSSFDQDLQDAGADAWQVTQRKQWSSIMKLKIDDLFDSILTVLLGIGAMSVVLTVVLGAF